MAHDHGPRGHTFDPAKLGRLDTAARRERFPAEVFVTALAPHPGLRYGDLGCGAGYFTFPVLDALAGEGTLYAVDTSAVMLEELRARLRAHPHGHRVQTVQSSESRVPLADGALDAAMLGALFHELDDRAAYLAEVRRLLAPGGRVWIADWDRRPGQHGAAEHGPPYDHRVPREEAEAALREAAFTDLRAYPGFRDAYLVSARR